MNTVDHSGFHKGVGHYVCGIPQFVLLVFCPISHNVGALERFWSRCLNITYGAVF